MLPLSAGQVGAAPAPAPGAAADSSRDQAPRGHVINTPEWAKKYDAGRFSFNLPKGRCGNCEGEGWVMVELLFLPSVYTPCPTCHGARYNDKTRCWLHDTKERWAGF